MPIKNIISVALSKTAKNTYFVLFGNSAGFIFAFVYTVLLGNLLKISDFGYFSAIFSVLLLVSDIFDIGIGSSLSRFLPPLKQDLAKQNAFLKTAFLLQFFIAVTVSLLMLLISEIIAVYILHDRNFSHLVRIMSLGIGGAIMANFFLQALAAKEKFFFNSIYSVSVGIFRVVSLAILILLSKVYLSNVVWAQTISYIFIAILGFMFIGPKFVLAKATISDLKKLLKFSSFLAISRGLTALSSRLDVIMLIALTGNATSTGIYAIASRVISIYPVFAGSFSTVIAPKLASAKKKSEIQGFLKKVIFVTLGLIASIVFLIGISQPFITILFGIDKIASVPIFRLLLISMIFFVGSIPSVSVAIYYLKKPQILSANALIQLLIVFFGNLLLIPLYGRNGATYSLITAYAVTLFLTSYLSLRMYKNIKD